MAVIKPNCVIPATSPYLVRQPVTVYVHDILPGVLMVFVALPVEIQVS